MAASARTLVTRSAWVVAAHLFPLSANTALAQPPGGAESAIIQLRDLDLSTDEGVKALYERIKTAARKVCFRETRSHGGIDQQARFFVCYEDTVANTVEHINQARLAALHREQSRLAAN